MTAPERTRAELARAFAARPSTEWRALLDEHDTCTRLVATAEEAEREGFLNSAADSRECGIGDLALPGLVPASEPGADCVVDVSAAGVLDCRDLWPSDREPLCAVVHRTRLSLSDTDATGAWQFDVVLRLVQAAEIELLRQQGVVDFLGAQCPRVHVEVDYTGGARFDDELDVELRLERLGTSSLHFSFDVRRGGELLARGGFSTVYVVDGSSTPIPIQVRTKLGRAE